VKLAFDASKPGPKAGTPLEAIGWHAVSDSFLVPQAGMAQSVHFELAAPDEMTVTGGVLVARRGDEVVHDALEVPASRAHSTSPASIAPVVTCTCCCGLAAGGCSLRRPPCRSSTPPRWDS
jgi:hypothetical protein